MKKSVVSIALIMLLLFAGCGRNEQIEDTSSTLPIAENTTVSESTTIADKETTNSETAANQNSNSDTTTKPTEQKSAGQSTTNSTTTTQKNTTTQKQATTKSTTTQKQTTIKRVTTTKKTTTTEFKWNCNVDGHTCDTGQIGWVNSFDVARDKALEYIGSHDASGNFRVEQCHMCGKYTAFITLD